MPFNTLTFGIFFACVLVLHAALRNWQARKCLLLGASYLFYAAWNPPFSVLLAFTTVVDWHLARRIGRSERQGVRRFLLGLSLASNLGVLAYFKYGQFALKSFTDLAAQFGFVYQAPALDIVLPAGISFYTFQSLSYTIDVYRRQIRGDTKLLDFALFVSFFPQLVAGPIVRAVDFIPQLLERRQITGDKMGWGCLLLLFGLFQKVVLADFVFAPVVDAFYDDPSSAGWLDAWAGVIAFSGQIFCDFAGYSLCAIGSALCLGFSLPDNFRAPYATVGFSDFWRRWHISLSTWLRDYLYIPLGGGRHGERRTHFNLMFTMLIGGLWHGASWMFVLWGGLHGLYLLVEHRYLSSRLPQEGLSSVLAGLVTFCVATLTWIPFRAMDAAHLMQALSALVAFDRPANAPLVMLGMVFLSVYSLLRFQWANRNRYLEDWFPKLSPSAQWIWVSSALIGIFLASGGQQRAFIYFQF